MTQYNTMTTFINNLDESTFSPQIKRLMHKNGFTQTIITAVSSPVVSAYLVNEVTSKMSLYTMNEMKQALEASKVSFYVTADMLITATVDDLEDDELQDKDMIVVDEILTLFSDLKSNK